MLNSVLLSIINITRSRSIRASVILVEVTNYLLCLISLITVLEDENLAGLDSALECKHVLFCVVFVFLIMLLKQFGKLLKEMTVSWNKAFFMRYKAIEDKIFMEEYENPEQQFSITSL